METIRKDYEAAVELKDGSRLVTAIISTDSVDRDGEIVLPRGLVRKQYSGNPVVLWTHDRKTSLPIGKCNGIKVEARRIIAQYYVTDKTQLGRDVFSLLQDGVLKAHSVNLQPIVSSHPTAQELAERPDWVGARIVHRQWELLEFSVVTIPCNTEALTLAVAKCSPETCAMLGKSWEQEEDCWEWNAPPVKVKAIQKPEPEPIPVVREIAKPEPKPIRQPSYCRSLSEIRKELQEVVSHAATADDFLRMITGKA